MRIRRLVPLAAITGSLVMAASASADSVAVTTTTDVGAGGACELRDAITAVTDGSVENGCVPDIASGADTITFDPALTDQTIDLPMGELVVDDPDPLSIVGPGMNGLTLSAGSDARVLRLVSGTLSISGLRMQDGAPAPSGANLSGGCILGEGEEATLTLTDVMVTNCKAELSSASGTAQALGGAIASLGTLTVDHSALVLNRASASSSAPSGGAFARGGAIYEDSPSGTLTIIDSSIEGNLAGAASTDGGEARATGGVDTFSPTQITNSTISQNSGSVDKQNSPGGAQAVAGLKSNAETQIELSTIVGNISDESFATNPLQAPGIYVEAGDLTVDSSTVALNGPTSGSLDGSALRVNGLGSATVSNTIVSDPRGGGANCLNDGTLTSAGFNDDFSSSGPSCGFGQSSDIHVDPLFESSIVLDNGGPTGTLRFEATSPVIDRGSSSEQTDPTVDQRGFARPVDFSGVPNAAGGNGTDIGAFEFQSTCTGQALPDGPCPGGGGGGGGNPPAPPPPASTGLRHKALKKCKKINPKKAKTKKAKQKKAKTRKKCIKRAKKLPV